MRSASACDTCVVLRGKWSANHCAACLAHPGSFGLEVCHPETLHGGATLLSMGLSLSQVQISFQRADHERVLPQMTAAP